MIIERIKERLGGVWYDTWWCAIFEWLHHPEYPQEFWTEINQGWLEMYDTPPKKQTQQELLNRFLTLTHIIMRGIMMIIEITIEELEESFEEYIDRAHMGERFLIIDHNVMLVPTDDV